MIVARRRNRTAAASLLLAAVLITWWFSGYVFHDLLGEMAILAIFAMSLDFVVGYAGLPSLGHALYLGLAAYTVAALTVFFSWQPSLAMAAGIAVAAVAAALTGLIVVRFRGIFFLMITLAFGQMMWSYFLRSPIFGGYSGLAGVPQIDLNAVGLVLQNPADFALIAIAACTCIYVALARIVDSSFGHMLVAIHQNEVRARALGLPVTGYKLAAYVIAGALAGVAGTLAVQRTQFVSPDSMIWTASGEALIVVILGGVGTLVGPIIGAIVWVFLRHLLSGYTSFWMIIMGTIFICVILFSSDGIYGLVARRLETRRHA